MSSYQKLDVTITSSKRTWCDVTVHRQGKPDLATRVRKISAAGLPLGEKITVSGRVEWNKNRFGTTSELLIFSDDQVNEMKLEEAQQLIAKVRECATQRCYIPEKTVERLRRLAGRVYDAEINDLRRQLAIQIWIGRFRDTLNIDGYIYERAVQELHNVGCHDYDSEIKAARKHIEEEKARKREEKRAAEKAAGIVNLALPAYNGFNGRPEKGDVFEENDRVYRVISSYYNRHDGYSFGVMNEEWYSVKAQDITETETGKSMLKEKEATQRKAAAVSECENALDALKWSIKSAGSPYRTEETITLDCIPGEAFFDNRNIYGGGCRLQRDGDTMYYIVNNGFDGGNWSLNNILTGGAGAYAYVVATSDVKKEYDRLTTAIAAAESYKDRLSEIGFMLK